MPKQIAAFLLIATLALAPAVFANPLPDETVDLPCRWEGETLCVGVEFLRVLTNLDGDSVDDFESERAVRMADGLDVWFGPREVLPTAAGGALGLTRECFPIESPSLCDTEPERCVDCNANPGAECPGTCLETYYFSLPALCLPHGNFQMEVQQQEGDNWEYLGQCDEIKFTQDENCDDTEQSVCNEAFWTDEILLPVPADDDDDDNDTYPTDENDDDDDNDNNDSGGCATHRSPTIPMLALMLGVGLLALALRRRR
ncbi:MAG: hypothetical protein P9L99_20695 [Candidatus Lernaella stagnicola]|nr:hypothetical protein [Candidatus Lernaella stagnicola]